MGLGLVPLSDPLPLAREVVLNTWHCVGAQPFLLMHSCETMTEDKLDMSQNDKKEGGSDESDGRITPIAAVAPVRSDRTEFRYVELAAALLIYDLWLSALVLLCSAASSDICV